MIDGWVDGWMNRRNGKPNKQEEIRVQRVTGESGELIVIKSYQPPT